MQEAANALVKQLVSSAEYKEYEAAKARMLQDELQRGVYQSFLNLKLEVQADALSGVADEEKEDKLRRYGELLQMQEEASAFFMAEYRLHALLGTLYEKLANAVGIDLSGFENG